MGAVIAVVNMKGGVGKTTITVNLASCLARNYKKRVLVIDLDTQINATLSLIPPLHFAKLKQEQRTLRTLISKVLQPDIEITSNLPSIVQTQVCEVRGLDLIPGDIELYNDLWLATMIYTRAATNNQDFTQVWQLIEDSLISNVIAPLIKLYDFILLDFSPGDNLITRSGILASDYYLIPAKPEPLSVIGIGMLEGRIQQFRESQRSQIKRIGIILTSLGHATTMGGKIKHRLKEEFGKENIFKTEIPLNVDVAKAVDSSQPVVLNNPQATGAKALINVTQEFIQRFSLITAQKE